MEKVYEPLCASRVPIPMTAGFASLGIFAKAPVAGQVKTRLSPPLTPHECAEFQRLALLDTVATLAEFAPVLFYSGDEGFFRETFPALPRVPQGAGDLGVRMARAFRELFALGATRAALVGSDSPDLPPLLVTEALAALDTHKAVCIPSTDGGYVLIGERGHHPALFCDVPWSTDQVLTRTRQIAATRGLTLAEHGPWEDVDDYAGLLRLAQRTPRSAAGIFAGRMRERYGLSR